MGSDDGREALIREARDALIREAIREALGIAVDQADEAREAKSDWVLGVRLKMASRALRSALKLYGELIER